MSRERRHALVSESDNGIRIRRFEGKGWTPESRREAVQAIEELLAELARFEKEDAEKAMNTPEKKPQGLSEKRWAANGTE